jgi:hypothetical protein
MAGEVANGEKTPILDRICEQGLHSVDLHD